MASLKALTVEYLNTSNNVLTVHNHSLWYNILFEIVQMGIKSKYICLYGVSCYIS